METKLTAVEWLAEQLWRHHIKIDITNTVVFQQAKAMEKHQIIAANEDCSTNELGELFTGEQYYNETYGN